MFFVKKKKQNKKTKTIKVSLSNDSVGLVHCAELLAAVLLSSSVSLSSISCFHKLNHSFFIDRYSKYSILHSLQSYDDGVEDWLEGLC